MPPRTWPEKCSVSRAPSDTRSTTSAVPVADASTATTVSEAPPASSATGAATDTATGSRDSALSSDDESRYACACDNGAIEIATALKVQSAIRCRRAKPNMEISRQLNTGGCCEPHFPSVNETIRSGSRSVFWYRVALLEALHEYVTGSHRGAQGRAERRRHHLRGAGPPPGPGGV